MHRLATLAVFIGLVGSASVAQPTRARAGGKASSSSVDPTSLIIDQLDDTLPVNLIIGEVVLPKNFELPKGARVSAAWRKPPKEGHAFVLVEVIRKGKSQRRLFVRVELLAVHDVLVAQRSLAEGDVISEGDLDLEPRIGVEGIQLDPAGLMGSPVLADLAKGDSIDASSVGLPAPVARGTTVKVLVRVGNARVEAQARLETTARPGEQVRVRVASTRRMVTGLLRDPHTVEVIPGAQE